MSLDQTAHMPICRFTDFFLCLSGVPREPQTGAV